MFRSPSGIGLGTIFITWSTAHMLVQLKMKKSESRMWFRIQLKCMTVLHSKLTGEVTSIVIVTFVAPGPAGKGFVFRL